MRLRIADFGLRVPLAGVEARYPKSTIHNPQSAIGFTLVEIVVVLAILALTAAAVVPAFTRAIDDDPVTAAARRLERILLDARATALTRAVAVRVTVVPETGRYMVYEEGGGAAIVLDSGWVALTPGLRLWSAAARPTIRFSPVGVVDGDSLLVLGATGARALVIARWTGAVHADAR
jgi:prepilin-type N-terminal cleavage/methylation domain-containing protein